MSNPSLIPIRNIEEGSPSFTKILSHLDTIRQIRFVPSKTDADPELPFGSFQTQAKWLTDVLFTCGHPKEAEALGTATSLSLLSTDLGGLGYSPDADLTPEQEVEIAFLVSAWLESLNSADFAKVWPKPLLSRPEGRRAMTLSEKIFAAHDVDRKGTLKPGDVVRVSVDWIIASELSWHGMKRDYDALGKPGIFRNDRFWLAGDHVVDPRINGLPKVKALITSSVTAKEDFRMTEYQGNNYTIMHTEFCRERAQPGMLVIGSDSHTCSAGSIGALAIGLGIADVTMPLITGETWFKIPESVNICLVNSPSPGIGGKDTILYIMQQLKRNTVASERIVEFTGPGVAHLSCDARFAIANMCTEFGGITGIFVPDEITNTFVQARKDRRHKSKAQYFRPDDDAVYAETHVIDLSKIESFVARYPKPDDVVPVSELADTALNGCFIGACTTAEEDLIIGALVLQAGLKKGLIPVAHGKRKVVPGSLPILHRLRSLGFAAIYEKSGFEVGIPGCSYCVGMGADKAAPGEVWLSSQNRNFENRMGTGSIGHLGSAATVAASSFRMRITDPRDLLGAIAYDELNEILNYREKVRGPKKPVVYVEPGHSEVSAVEVDVASYSETQSENLATPEKQEEEASTSAKAPIIEGKVNRLSDFIDTDALAPAEALTSCVTDAEFGEYCLKHTHPDFRSKAKSGFNVVVAGKAFGVGSSRENAVNALKGCGIHCVIAKSFAFIYGRNQPNLGLLGITITDEAFYATAFDGADIKIDLDGRTVMVGGNQWDFELSAMELKLIEIGGISGAFMRWGKRLFEIMCAPAAAKSEEDQTVKKVTECESTKELQW